MCDIISMPDGRLVDSISEDEACLCVNTQKEILTWIVQELPAIEDDQTIEILKTFSGWEVSIRKGEDEN